jgi:hypothetical protein
MEAWRQQLLGGRKTFVSEKEPGTHYEPRIPLTPTGLLMEGHFTSVRFSFAFFGYFERYGDISSVTI